MKRLFLYILILNALWFAPLNRVEIANLEPVRAVWLDWQNDQIHLETDTGSRGTGQTVTDALVNLKETSSGIVYLDTAEYLLVSEDATKEITALVPYVKKSVRLCQWDGEGDMEWAVKYVNAHKIGTKIRHWKTDDKLPNLPSQNLSK